MEQTDLSICSPVAQPEQRERAARSITGQQVVLLILYVSLSLSLSSFVLRCVFPFFLSAGHLVASRSAGRQRETQEKSGKLTTKVRASGLVRSETRRSAIHWAETEWTWIENERENPS